VLEAASARAEAFWSSMIHESDPVAHATYLGRVRYWDAVLGELLSRVSWIACDSESDSRPSRGDRRRVSLFSAPTARPGCRRADSERCRVRAVGDPDETTALLREWFPDGRADEHNLVLFSTSGVHGSYLTLEDARRSLESGAERELVTVLLLSPRLVRVLYGQCSVRVGDLEFLEELRRSSWEAAAAIGRERPDPLVVARLLAGEESA
jgi:hypothetical protein